VVGDGLYLRFKVTFRSNTAYRVCYSRGKGRQCFNRHAGTRGRFSRIFIAAPSNVGTYIATWSVNGKTVARWSWYNGVGD
jgi:hypothetical protein